jgi:hypothetical protein
MASYSLSQGIMKSPHVSIADAVAFILDGIGLNPLEEAHLLSCQQCQSKVIEAALEELERRESENSGEAA